MIRLLSFIAVFAFINSCSPPGSDITGQQQTYVPIYSSLDGVNDIAVQPKKLTVEAGKIYAYGNYIFQNDLNTGIHIIDNTDKQNPAKIAFLKIPLSTEVAVKGSFLYTNNYTDLVVFDISSPANPKLVKRVSNVFPSVNQNYPPFTNVYFECPDKSKGIVVDWELKTIANPKCRR